MYDHIYDPLEFLSPFTFTAITLVSTMLSFLIVMMAKTTQTDVLIEITFKNRLPDVPEMSLNILSVLDKSTCKRLNLKG